jgi:hypothetical protein
MPESAEYRRRYPALWERSRDPHPIPDLGAEGVSRVAALTVVKAQESGPRRWEEFTTSRRGAQFIGMSMPAFSADNAVLYVEQYREQGGFGGMMHLKLKDGKWSFSDLEVIWLLD